MLRKTPSTATVVCVEKIVRRPYKVNVEVRLSSGGYSVTLVARGTRPLSGIARALRRNGYDYVFYIDSYGYARLHIRGLSFEDIVIIKKLAYENILRRKKQGEALAVAL